MGDEEARLQGLADVFQYMLGFMDSMALKCAVELGIPDIINSHGHPITISEIMDSIIDGGASSPDIDNLSRIMRFLVHKHVFSAQLQPETGETFYGLTHCSKWLLASDELTLAPLVKISVHQCMVKASHHLSDCVKNCESGFMKAFGSSAWKMASENPEFNELINEGMGCTSKVITKALVVDYKDAGGFEGITSLVDVAGGTGTMINEIVKANPLVRGINFDLPHVIATAPEYPGVEHIGGDMFIDIPHADAVIMKNIMHDWSDEDNVKILKNCRKAIPLKTGKIIILDLVLQPDGQGGFRNTGTAFDLLMMANTEGGKERTEQEWKKLLKDGGFPRYNIIQIRSFLSIIEAYAE